MMTRDEFPVSDFTGLCDQHQTDFGWSAAYYLDRAGQFSTPDAMLNELHSELAMIRASCERDCGRVPEPGE